MLNCRMLASASSSRYSALSKLTVEAVPPDRARVALRRHSMKAIMSRYFTWRR
jgi:hypothetical protein